MATYRAALVDPSGAIVNVVVLDDEAQWTPPEGLSVVRDDSNVAAIGGTYIDGQFTKPPQPDPDA